MKFLQRAGAWMRLRAARTYCPVCDTFDVVFNGLPDFYRQQAQANGFVHFGHGEMTAHETYSCAICGASDRERLYAYWLRRELDRGTVAGAAIHFAPEQALSKFIKAQGLFDEYRTADLHMAGVDCQVDLMSLPFEDNCFDFFVCSHVLEHVQDDDRALKELLRITKAGGRGILMAPIIVGLSATIEDPAATSEAERWRLFGQHDHVRLYAHDDYVRRLEQSGFLLRQYGESHFGAGVFRRLGLKPTSILYIVLKPNRSA